MTRMSTSNPYSATRVPDLSVVMSYFNQPEELARALEDILRQQDVTLEVLVVDDASERKADNIVACYQKRGLPVSLLRQPKRAYTLAARLRGMRVARGRWLAFMDSDDGLCGPDVYAKIISAAEKTPDVDILHYLTMTEGEPATLRDKTLSVSMCGRYLWDWPYAAPFHDAPLHGSEIFHTWLLRGCRAHSVWNKLYSRRLYTRLLELRHDIPITRIEDFYLTAHFLFFAKKYVPCYTSVYKYSPPTTNHLLKLAGRMTDAIRMLQTLPGRFSAMGLDKSDCCHLYTYLRKLVTINTGHMCRQYLKITNGSIDLKMQQPDEIDILNQYNISGEVFLALAVATASNSRKLKNIVNILNFDTDIQ